MASNDLRMRGETWCPGLSSLTSMGRFRARTGASRISGDIRLRFGSSADQTCFSTFLSILEDLLLDLMASHTELSRLNQLMKIEDAAMRNQLKEAVSRLLTSVLQVRRWWFFVLFEISRILEIISRRSSIFTEISTETMTFHIFRLDRSVTETFFI